MTRIYQDPSVNHDEAVRLLASHLDANVVHALVSIGLNEEDRVWAQDTCLGYLESGSESETAAAVTALGHIARRFGEINLDKVTPAFERVKLKFPSLEAITADTLDDIEMFT
ncbi:hypothetical protein [Pseudomonas sp. NFX15]|uniref:hypothetical protein n=1 Tax=Pseudomonas sp. NFX15 TaxID=2816958 RepID=UPI003B8CB643